jgi:hypothetical protein
VEISNGPTFDVYDSFSIGAWIRPAAANGAIVSRIKDQAEGQGLVLYLDEGRLAASMNQRWLDDGIRVETQAKVPVGQWSHVMLTYDGSRLASGVNLYVNGERQRLNIPLDDLNQSISASQPWRIGTGLGPENRFRGEIDELRLYRTALAAEDVAVLARAETLNKLAGLRKSERNKAQAGKLRAAFLDRHAPAPLIEAQRRVFDLTDDLEHLRETIPTVMVMQESAAPRATHLLIRGAYDRPGEKVEPGVPAALPALAKGLPNNRLGFSKWLVDGSNPLTARVAVNRFWQMLFGTGLVKTSEDFGSQGEWPSHPELLDWLATEFVGSGWDVKGLLKTMVLSATYRQSSAVRPELLAKDPENRLLSRGPRLRLRPEMVRDQALAVAGLLVEKVGGPSVKPYQPAGLWRELTGGADYRADRGEGLYRRSLYTFWKRTSPPPMMMNFDAAGREVCMVREGLTNTPLQALNLMNDVQFLEAARFLGQRMMREGGAAAEERIAYGFQLATARRPDARESEILRSSWNYYRDLYQTDAEAAAKYLSQGDSRPDPNLDAKELAAYATVASLILNLDATVTKE